MTHVSLSNFSLKLPSLYASYSQSPKNNDVLTYILQAVLCSSQTGALGHFEAKGFVALSSTCKTFHINSQLIWKNLLLHHNYGCLKVKALAKTNPALFKVIFLQLTRLQISFETPRFIFKAGERGCIELKNLLDANENLVRPEKMLFVNKLPPPSEHQAFVKALVRDINTFKEEDAMSSPLLQAIYHRDIELVRAMLDYDCAHVNAPRYEDPFALIKAIEEDMSEIACLLIEFGWDLEKTNSEGLTPLMIAAYKGKIEIVRLLIEKNVNVHAVDRSGQSAHDHSLDKENVHQVWSSYSSKDKPYPELERQKEITKLLAKPHSDLKQTQENKN